jgi:hypothetical protein
MEINMAKIMERGMLLPIGRDDQGNIRFATPEFVMGLIDSFKLPGQVMFQGKQPTYEDALNFSLNMAGLGQATKFIGPLAKESGAVLAMNAPVRSTAAPLSEAAQIARLMKANKDKYNMKEFFNFVANKEPGSSYFHVSKIPNLDKDNFNYLSSKLDFDDAHKGIFPKGATSKEGAFVVDNPESVLALRQQGGQFGPFSDYKNTYIFRANPDKVQPRFQPMKKTKESDPMVMEGYLPKESITSMEKILTAKNLEEFFRRK